VEHGRCSDLVEHGIQTTGDELIFDHDRPER
jgi:hypothetical protein